MEIESPAEGTILDIKVPEGEGVPPGTVICYIGEGNEQIEEKKEKDLTPKQKKERKKISLLHVRLLKALIWTFIL